jgi:hypothetical protein
MMMVRRDTNRRSLLDEEAPMRRCLNRCLSAFALATVAAVASGQQPVNGCNAAPSCRANVLWALTGNAGGHVLMSFGVAWNPGFHLGLVTRPIPPSGAEDNNGDQRFHLHTPLLPALPAAPGLTPSAPNFEKHSRNTVRELRS